MSPIQIVLGIIQIVFCIILITVIILQEGKSAGLSGSIAGGAETFFGRNKGRTIEAKLEKWTTAVAVGFIVVTLILNFI
jgi:preprotein translocase subunit SecG